MSNQKKNLFVETESGEIKKIEIDINQELELINRKTRERLFKKAKEITINDLNNNIILNGIEYRFPLAPNLFKNK